MATPRRSILYLPGANLRAMEKARELAADGLIFDLEDAVAPGAKSEARLQVAAAVRAGGYGRRELVVRVNALETPWGADDLDAVAGLPIAAVLLPKIDRPVQVQEAVARLEAAGAPGSLDVWVMAETPRGLLALDAIAAASPRIRVIVAGTSDLAKELRVPARADRLGLLASLSHCVLVARARALEVLDGVELDLADPAGFAAACEQGRALGFDGKTLIHPTQIDAANQVFGPSPAAVAAAEEIMHAWQQAQAEGRGMVVVKGRLVENLHIEEAERLLALARAIREASN
jgi:citrate lyase subunit beta / citryl-CoA lyase